MLLVRDDGGRVSEVERRRAAARPDTTRAEVTPFVVGRAACVCGVPSRAARVADPFVDRRIGVDGRLPLRGVAEAAAAGLTARLLSGVP